MDFRYYFIIKFIWLQGTILNDDGVVFSIADASGPEGNGGAGVTNNNITFTITATPAVPAGDPITVTWETSVEDGDGATETTDFTPITSGSEVFMATETEKMIDVAIIGDTDPEEDEKFTVTITSVTLGGQISDSNGSAKGTITNDDGIGFTNFLMKEKLKVILENQIWSSPLKLFLKQVK